MYSEEEEVALLCLLICDDGKRKEKRKQFGLRTSFKNEMDLEPSQH